MKYLVPVLLAVTSGYCAAQAPIYRCGNSYSDHPCQGSREVAQDRISVVPRGPKWTPTPQESQPYVPPGSGLSVMPMPADKFKDYKKYDSYDGSSRKIETMGPSPFRTP